MLRAFSLKQLIEIMQVVEPGEPIQVSNKLLKEYIQEAGRTRLNNPMVSSRLPISAAYGPQTPREAALGARDTFVQNIEHSEEEVMHCENKDQAQALADLLWNEKERHAKDIRNIEVDLNLIWHKWHITPHYKRRFVKP